MKRIKYILVLFVLVALVSSCGLDNYDAPQSKLHGKISYEGKSIGLRGTGEAIQLQLYQDGYDLKDKIDVYVKQDGTFEALLFDGEYKLVTRDKNGPWVNSRDTTLITLKGATTIKLEVVPYFMISDSEITLSSSTLKSTFNLEKIVATAEIEHATLLVSKTSFVDDISNIFRKEFKDVTEGNVVLEADLSDNSAVTSAVALYARVGVKTKGVDQAIYSDIVKLK